MTPFAFPGSLGEGVLGSTDRAGMVTLAEGLPWNVQASTMRHESVHAFLSVVNDAAFAGARQSFGMSAYNNSQLMRFTEEAIAETYGSGSLMQGLAHPIANGYGITAGGLATESLVFAGTVGGAGYLSYKLGSK